MGRKEKQTEDRVKYTIYIPTGLNGVITDIANKKRLSYHDMILYILREHVLQEKQALDLKELTNTIGETTETILATYDELSKSFKEMREKTESFQSSISSIINRVDVKTAIKNSLENSK